MAEHTALKGCGEEEFLVQHLQYAIGVGHYAAGYLKKEHLHVALHMAPPNGLLLEFGVANGITANWVRKSYGAAGGVRYYHYQLVIYASVSTIDEGAVRHAVCATLCHDFPTVLALHLLSVRPRWCVSQTYVKRKLAPPPNFTHRATLPSSPTLSTLTRSTSPLSPHRFVGLSVYRASLSYFPPLPSHSLRRLASPATARHLLACHLLASPSSRHRPQLIGFDEFKTKRLAYHGFDSFKGLPTAFSAAYPAGTFARPTPPPLPASAKLHVGWFQDTLPGFLAANPAPISFVHNDQDLYGPTKYVQGTLACTCRFQKGTIVAFDEVSIRGESNRGGYSR